MQKDLDLLDAPGSTYKDYSITKYLRLTELSSTLIEVTHEKSGAKIVHIANDDPENVFCLSFQTLPSSSNGVAHILEHTVLCGSRKFPVKDPFFAMTRRSLNTYMNALTGQDFTCYPAASQVEKDFYNLLKVYMDAAFYPFLKKMSFLQEGHRLEFVDPKNPKGPLQFQGVVYNEMKGAMSAIESRLWEALMKHLTPDLPYAFNSGGNPREIPNLSYEELKSFHQTFYHPSRCTFFFYGNLPLAKHLDAIEPILSDSDKLPPLLPIPKQKRFISPVRVTESYPVTKEESLDKKTQIAFAFLTNPIRDQEEILAISLLESILTDTDASFLTKALLKSGLSTQVDSALDFEMSEIPWIFICKGTNEKDADALEKLLFDTLKKVCFNEEEIEAALHQLEFTRTEIGGEGGPFGLSLFFRSVLIKQHGCAPESALLIHSLFDTLRSRLKDPNYLPNLLKKTLIENPHFVRLVLKPDPSLAGKEAKEEESALRHIRERLSPQQEKLIEEEMIALKAHQEAIEHQSLDCLPKVTLKDISQETKSFPLGNEGNVFHHSCFTNHILYADLVFDLPQIAKEDLSLVSLLAEMIPELGAGKKNYEEMLQFQQAYIGGFDVSLSLNPSFSDPEKCFPTLSLRAKALKRNEAKIFELFKDVIEKIDFEDSDRIQEWLQQHLTELTDKIPRASMSYASQMSLSSGSTASYIYNEWHGLPYYQSLIKWVKSFDKQFVKKLQTLTKTIFLPSNCDLVLSCDDAAFGRLKKAHFFGFQTSRGLSNPFSLSAPVEKIPSQAYFIPAPVAFTSLGMKTISIKDPLAASLLISTELMSNLILHKEIREKGGAYGSGANYAPSTGSFNFYAYRDPQLAKTLKAFELAIHAIESKEFNERELEEAKLGVIQSLDAPVAPENRAFVAYSWYRQGKNIELRELFRKQILAATKEEIAQAVALALKDLPHTIVSFLGKELYEKENISLKLLPLYPA